MKAMLTLAWLHEHGKGVVKDEWYAAGLYIKAARHGEYEKGMFAYARIIYPSDFNHSKLLNYHKACYIWSKLSTKGVNPNIKEMSTKLFKKNCGS
jgi:TPR repeat protein